MTRSILYTLPPALLLISLLGLAGCAATGNGTASTRDSSTVEIDNPNGDLTNYLRRLPGVLVQGSGPNATIIVRGVSSFSSGTSPLFVIDGVRMGNNFRSVYEMVNLQNVKSIRVLKSWEASMYGIEGGNGVILVNYVGSNNL